MKLDTCGKLEHEAFRLVTLLDILVNELEISDAKEATNRCSIIAPIARDAAMNLSDHIQQAIHEK